MREVRKTQRNLVGNHEERKTLTGLQSHRHFEVLTERACNVGYPRKDGRVQRCCQILP
jgi:hypothetical protein